MAFPSFIMCAMALLVATSAAPSNNKVAIKIPDECKDKQGFCSIRPEGYDEIEEKINSLLPPFLSDFGDRISFGDPGTSIMKENDEDNCPSRLTTRSVYTHKSNNKTKVEIIVNTKLFPQIVETINCDYSKFDRNSLREERPQCFKQLGLNMDFNMKFTCQESTATRTLLVYDPDGHKIVAKNYTISVCCSCHITSI